MTQYFGQFSYRNLTGMSRISKAQGMPLMKKVFSTQPGNLENNEFFTAFFRALDISVVIFYWV